MVCGKNNVQKHIFEKFLEGMKKAPKRSASKPCFTWWGMLVSNQRPLECELCAIALLTDLYF